YWSVKYDMHTKEKKYDLRGVAIVKNSMIELNKIVLDLLLKNKLNPYCLPPTDFMSGNKPILKKIQEIKKIAESGLIPVTYGDALWFGQKKTYILSGDKIMTHLAKILKPRLCIFALNEDGLYSDLKSKKLIYELKNERPSISDNKMDVTGGMTRKVEEASNISKIGVNVFFVNGNKPERIVKAIKNGKFEGTLFRRRNV
ncbi:MAG: isopentenyl phosphate kinase, partial [Nitrosopumilus sp.]|nr:isopentenyl phosphate kinase [Nitrosopumilus sp.]